MAEDQTTDRFAIARKAMIDSQLRTSGVNAPYVLARMGKVAREDFVPASSAAVAYMDRAIRLEDTGYLPAPVVQGRMLEEAAPTLDDEVLLVDREPSYMAELLRPLVGKLDVVSPQDAAAGAKKRGKASLMIIHGAVEHVPDALANRLADDGRVVTGLADNGITRIAIGRKSEKDIAFYSVAETGMPVLEEFAKPKAWTF